MLVGACVNKESGSKESVPAIQVVEYRSETLKEYELFVIYFPDAAPQFLISRNRPGSVALIDKKLKTEDGYTINLIGFTALKLLHPSTQDKITSFAEIELVPREAGSNTSFKVSHTKRALTIGSSYSYIQYDESGELTLSQEGDSWNLQFKLKRERPAVRFQGRCRLKGASVIFSVSLTIYRVM